jgi:hypothetical protein
MTLKLATINGVPRYIPGDTLPFPPRTLAARNVYNIVGVSNVEGKVNREGSRFDGNNGRKFIGEVISEWHTCTPEQARKRVRELNALHQCEDFVAVSVT